MQQITISFLKSNLLLINNKLKGYEKLDVATTAVVIRDIIRITSSSEFQRTPKLYITAKKVERGPTTEVRIPEDVSIRFIELYLLQYFQKN